MKRLSLIVLLCGMAGFSVAQSSYLDTTYNLDGRSDWFGGVCRYGDNYYASTWSNANGIDDYGIAKLTPEGLLAALSLIKDSVHNDAGAGIISIEKGRLAIAIQAKDTSIGYYQYKLVIADTLLNVLITTPAVGVDSLHEAPQALCYSNAQIVLTGSKRDPHVLLSQNIYLIAWDTLGNFLWDRKVGTAQYNENSYGIVPTSDDGYMIAGYRQYIGQNRFDALVVKTDSLGNQEWEKTFGNTGDRNWFEGIVSDGQGNYYACGFTQLTGSINGFKARLIKLDESGNVIWNKEYMDEDMGIGNYELETGIINAEGDIVFVGGLRDTSFGKDVGWLLKLKPDGEKVWSRRITHQTHDHQYLRDIEQTPDGGYLLVGSIFNQPNDAWVVKVDSLGCMVAGCDTIRTGISSVPVPEDFYMGDPVPNPTTGAVSISYQLPPGTSGQMQVVDIHGRLLQTHAVHALDNQLELDLSGRLAGLVFVSLRIGHRQPVTKAVMVE